MNFCCRHGFLPVLALTRTQKHPLHYFRISAGQWDKLSLGLPKCFGTGAYSGATTPDSNRVPVLISEKPRV